MWLVGMFSLGMLATYGLVLTLHHFRLSCEYADIVRFKNVANDELRRIKLEVEQIRQNVQNKIYPITSQPNLISSEISDM